MFARAVTRRPGVVRPALAPVLLAVALTACGAGSPPTGDDASSTTGSSPFEPIAGAAVDAGTPIGTDQTPGSAGAPNPDAVPEAVPEALPSSEPEPEPEPESETETETDDADTGDEAGADADPSGDVVASGPVGCDASPDAIRARALELINAARAEARFCGEGTYRPAVAPLGWNARLEAAARAHSTDMATVNYFDHTGSDGGSPGDRIAREEYAYTYYAENIAAGQRTLEEAVAGWLGSPGHCRNLMQADVSETAIACVSDDGADYRHYWTQVLARPVSTRARP